MEEILENTFQLTGEDTKSNIRIPFSLKSDADELHISFLYSPGSSEDETATKQIIEGLKKYSLAEIDEDINVDDYLPIENFVAASLSKSGVYIGGHHNKSKEQKIIVSATNASLGFWKTAITAGEWELQLNCHCIASTILEVKVRIGVFRL